MEFITMNNHHVRDKIFGSFAKQIQVDYPALMGTSVCPFPFVDGLFSGKFFWFLFLGCPRSLLM